MAQQQRLVFNPPSAPQPLGTYSTASMVKAGRFLFIAGQLGVDTAGNLVGRGNPEAQARQAFLNIGQVLADAGATFSNVMEFTTYVVGRESVQPFIDARLELFPDIFPYGDYPPNTLLVVDGLVREEFLVEIKAVAVLP